MKISKLFAALSKYFDENRLFSDEESEKIIDRLSEKAESAKKIKSQSTINEYYELFAKEEKEKVTPTLSDIHQQDVYPVERIFGKFPFNAGDEFFILNSDCGEFVGKSCKIKKIDLIPYEMFTGVKTVYPHFTWQINGDAKEYGFSVWSYTSRGLYPDRNIFRPIEKIDEHREQIELNKKYDLTFTIKKFQLSDHYSIWLSWEGEKDNDGWIPEHGLMISKNHMGNCRPSSCESDIFGKLCVFDSIEAAQETIEKLKLLNRDQRKTLWERSEYTPTWNAIKSE